ncbi:MAG: LacI family DNA-binding transcriptional regulator [Christensenellales bacterium]|nr:LacI family transcriptional regulator [Clostridiales bacterium]
MEKNINELTNGLTIADVANEACCSVATASRVLSGSKYPVSTAMRTRVLDAAAKLGYSDNLKKRMLATDQNPFLGVIIPTFQNPRYLQFINGIEQAANREGHSTFIMNSHRNPVLERQLINSLIQKKIGALLLMSVDESSESLRHYLDLGGFACVFESNFPDLPNVLNAKENRFEAGRIATEHLLSQGHHSIAFLTTPLKHFQSRRLTLDGCRFAIEKHALPFSFQNIFMASEESDSKDSMYELEVGYSMAEKILQHPNRYTGIVCQNDMLAYGLISGLKAAGAHVPNNISVVGIDNIHFDNISFPRLTTVDTLAGMLAQRATQFMIRMDDYVDTNLVPLSMKPELIVRESVRAIG